MLEKGHLNVWTMMIQTSYWLLPEESKMCLCWRSHLVSYWPRWVPEENASRRIVWEGLRNFCFVNFNLTVAAILSLKVISVKSFPVKRKLSNKGMVSGAKWCDNRMTLTAATSSSPTRASTGKDPISLPISFEFTRWSNIFNVIRNDVELKSETDSLPGSVRWLLLILHQKCPIQRKY